MHVIAPSRQSFVSSAHGSEFPLQNLPYGIFSNGADARPRVGVAIGTAILDLVALADAGLLHSVPVGVLRQPSLNALARAGRPVWTRLRQELESLLVRGSGLQDHPVAATALLPMASAHMHLPFEIGDFTDFYASEHHAYHCGCLFRGPDNALPPNWKHMPIAYNGRASSIVPTGTPVRRPRGQVQGADGSVSWQPTAALDFELEVGLFIAADTELGQPVSTEAASDLIFGLVLLNDWSARDIQRWEYVPLGPFQSKAFATSVSPWVVPLDALEPFKIALPPQQPEVLPYLRQAQRASYDMPLHVHLKTAEGERSAIVHSNVRHLYWTMEQQIAHHTGSGCRLRVGDLLGSGTISGPGEQERGCLLELTRNGAQPLALPRGQLRSYLADGDTVEFTASASRNGFTVGFGSLENTVLPALP